MSLPSQRPTSNPLFVHRLAVLSLILIAFGFRIFFIERLPYDYDRSYSHGVGLTILYQLGHGLAPTALLHSESSNSGLTNPTLTNYVFAAIGLFDHSPYTATLITAALGAVVAAITYDLGKKYFGRRVGLIALAVVATSPWSAFFARGSWYTGYFELSAAVPAWLLLKALLRKPTSTKAIALGIISSAVVAHFYLVSFALVAQVAAVLFVARTQLRHKTKLFALFVIAWLISFVFVSVVISANRSSNIRPEGLSLVYGNPSAEEQAKLAAPGLNLVTLTRFGSLVGGRWEGWLEAMHTTTQDTLNRLYRPGLSEGWLRAYRLRASAIEAAAMIGFVVWLIQARTRLIIRLMLVWLLIPLLGQIIVTSLLPTFPANHQNLFLASPVSYLMVACGFATVFGLARKLIGSLSDVSIAAIRSMNALKYVIRALGLFALAVIPIVSWMADADALQFPKPLPPADAMPMLWQLRLGEAVRNTCTTLNAPENPFELSRLNMQYWAAGLMQDAGRVRAGADIHTTNADAWQVSAQGGDCAIRASSETAPPFARAIEVTAPELVGRVQVYKALAPPVSVVGIQSEVRANIG